MKVLVLDDDAHVLRAIARLLRCQGFDAMITTVPDVALREAWRRRVDVLVTDLDLGGDQSGVDVAREVLGWPTAIPVILHSGSLEQLAMQDRSLFARIVQKPDARGLINAITEIAHRREAPNGAAVSEGSTNEG